MESLLTIADNLKPRRTTRDLKTRGSYNQASYNQQFLQPGLLHPGVLTTRGS